MYECLKLKKSSEVLSKMQFFKKRVQHCKKHEYVRQLTSLMGMLHFW